MGILNQVNEYRKKLNVAKLVQKIEQQQNIEFLELYKSSLINEILTSAPKSFELELKNEKSIPNKIEKAIDDFFLTIIALDAKDRYKVNFLFLYRDIKSEEQDIEKRDVINETINELHNLRNSKSPEKVDSEILKILSKARLKYEDIPERAKPTKKWSKALRHYFAIVLSVLKKRVDFTKETENPLTANNLIKGRATGRI